MFMRSKTHYGEKALKAGYQYVASFFGDSDEPVSFNNYKIDYGRCLGEGTFGCVYEISPRPEKEKGCLARWLPYAYDYLYPTEPSNSSNPRYCVKVFKSSIRISVEYLRKCKPHKAVVYPLLSLFNPRIEKSLYDKLHEHKLTGMEFVPTNGIYAQFKTRITGDTFRAYVEKGAFLQPNADGFQLRKSFVGFLSTIEKSPLRFWDMYCDNLMYDKQQNRWEIIDGWAQEVSAAAEAKVDGVKPATSTSPCCLFFKDLQRKAKIAPRSQQVLDRLCQLAQKGEVYTLDMDRALLAVDGLSESEHVLRADKPRLRLDLARAIQAAT